MFCTLTPSTPQTTPHQQIPWALRTSVLQTSDPNQILSCWVRKPQKVYIFSFIVGTIIPKSVKCIHSATKPNIRIKLEEERGGAHGSDDVTTISIPKLKPTYTQNNTRKSPRANVSLQKHLVPALQSSVSGLRTLYGCGLKPGIPQLERSAQ